MLRAAPLSQGLSLRFAVRRSNGKFHVSGSIVGAKVKFIGLSAEIGKDHHTHTSPALYHHVETRVFDAFALMKNLTVAQVKYL
ncbi:MAG: hypothetical protein ABJH45_10595 [Paracoccaceae bacterium]